MNKYSFYVLLSLIISQSSYSQKLYPVDESKDDSSFYNFKVKLLEAIENKDKDYLIITLNKNIMTSFGGDGGVDEFKQMWDIDNPESEVWSELKTVLSLGGSFYEAGDEILFLAPYVFSEWPEDLDAFEYSAVIDSAAPLYAEPNNNSELLRILSYDIVKLDYSWDQPGGWLKVETMDGVKGYIKPGFLRSFMDYRAAYKKVNDTWKMSFFVSGD